MNDFDFPNAIGFLIFQPIFGFIICALTILICIILGLPIRLITGLNNWWVQKPFIVFVGVAIGLILLLMSLFITHKVIFIKEGQETAKQVPNIILAGSGWFLTAFCLLHFYPLALIKWFKEKIVSKKNKNSESELRRV